MAISFRRAFVNRRQAESEIKDLAWFIEIGGGGTYLGTLFVYEGDNSSVILLSPEEQGDRAIVKIEGNIIYRLRYRTSHLYKALKEVAEERGYILKLCDEIDNDDISSLIFYNWNGKLGIDGGKLCTENRLDEPDTSYQVDWSSVRSGIITLTTPF